MNRARFGIFDVGLQDGSLRKRGQLIRLQEKPFQALALLLEHAGEVVTREQFRQRLWPAGTFVEFDDNLNSAIKRLREALGDTAESPRFVETVPRRGYRFIAAVERPDELPAAKPAADRGRWWVAATLGVLLASSIAAAGRPPTRPSPPYRLIVLPFANIGSLEEQFFADGVTTHVTCHLRRLYPERLVVIASSGPDRQADFLVTGSVQRKGGSGSLSVHFTRTRDHARLWSTTFRLPLQEIFVSDDIGQRVAGSLSLTIPSQERTELSRAMTVNAAAYEDYLRGLERLHRGNETSTLQAIVFFQQAMQDDPQYAMPYAGLAHSYISAGRSHVMPAPQSEHLAGEAIDRGLLLDPAIAEFHLLRADLGSQRHGNHEAVERDYERAIQLDPNDVEGHEHYALYLRERRPRQALAEIGKARDLDPLSPWLNACVGWVLISNDRLEEASVQLHQALLLDPRLPDTMRFLANAEMRRGRMGVAIAWFEKAADASGRAPFFVYRLGLAYASAGREAGVRSMLDELQDDATRRYVDPQFISSLKNALGG